MKRICLLLTVIACLFNACKKEDVKVDDKKGNNAPTCLIVKAAVKRSWYTDTTFLNYAYDNNKRLVLIEDSIMQERTEYIYNGNSLTRRFYLNNVLQPLGNAQGTLNSLGYIDTWTTTESTIHYYYNTDSRLVKTISAYLDGRNDTLVSEVQAGNLVVSHFTSSTGSKADYTYEYDMTKAAVISEPGDNVFKGKPSANMLTKTTTHQISPSVIDTDNYYTYEYDTAGKVITKNMRFGSINVFNRYTYSCE